MNRVRLSGGDYGGRYLPVGPGVRPTEGRVREALFSIWGPKIQGARLLDLYAGSGVVGVEALGRGAADVIFVEGNRRVARTLSTSLRELGVEGDRVVSLRLPGGLSRLREGSFDLVFADPPYDFDDTVELLASVRPFVPPPGELVLEHRRGRRLAGDSIPGWEVFDERIYGECGLTFLRRPESPEGVPES